ncbi:MAG: RagB/SusD family nutrient uptake outer membrane protein, partial [Hymenobacter sp.]
VYALERVHAPLVRDVTVNGVAAFSWPIGDYTGGRGVGFMAPSFWFGDSVWRSDFNNDIRNANHNFVRVFTATNPASPLYNQPISTLAPPAGSKGTNGAVLAANRYDRAFYPYQSKATQPYVHPTALYENPNNANPVLKYLLKAGAGGLYIDQYMFRLAETYLLRAEAYVGLGNTTAAAADINRVRARSNANPVTPGNVNIDYILDERLRELGVEEKRAITLMRLGKWVDRVRRLNPVYSAQVKENYNLWPIPFSEIERNRTAVLEQNPGY